MAIYERQTAASVGDISDDLGRMLLMSILSKVDTGTIRFYLLRSGRWPERRPSFGGRRRPSTAGEQQTLDVEICEVRKMKMDLTSITLILSS